MRLNLSSKLALAFVLVTLPAIVAMGVLVWFDSRSTIRELVRQEIGAVNGSKEAHLRQSLDSLRANVQALGEDPSIAEALRLFSEASAPTSDETDAEDTPALWEYFRKTYPADPGLPVPEPADTGVSRRLQELYVARNPFPLRRHDELLAPENDASSYSRIHRRYHPVMRRYRDANRLHNLMLVDAASRRVVYAVTKQADFQTSLDGPTLAGTNLKAAVEKALKGETVFADYQRFPPAFNDPVAYFVAPIRSSEGTVSGAVVGQIRPDFLTTVLQEEPSDGVRRTSDTFIVGADGYFRSEPRIVREDLPRLIRWVSAEGRPVEMIRRLRDKKTAVMVLGLPEKGLRTVRLNGRGFAEATGFDGQDVFSTYEPVQAQGVRWTIVTRRLQSEVLAPLAGLRRGIILAGAAILLLGAIVSSLIARSLVRPIQGLGDAARRFGAGDRDVIVPETARDDEIGELARQFGAMVAERARLENIQGQIRRNIVHDLKTPVTVIKGMGETLMIPEMADDPSWRDEMVRAIVSQSDRLLDDLRDILLPINETYTPEYEEFDLGLLVSRAVQAEKQTTRSRDHFIHLELPAEPSMVRADRRKIRRVVENLLSNAVKYSPGNGKEVWVQVRLDADVAEVSVRDEGLGMTEEDLRRVLNEGGRVGEHADLGIEGSGFGLDSVKRVLKGHGGELRVESSPNRGSTFIASFPRGAREPSTTPTPRSDVEVV